MSYVNVTSVVVTGSDTSNPFISFANWLYIDVTFTNVVNVTGTPTATVQNIVSVADGYRINVTLTYQSGSGSTTIRYGWQNMTGGIVGVGPASPWITLANNSNVAVYSPIIANANGSNSYPFTSFTLPVATALSSKDISTTPAQNRITGGVLVPGSTTDTSYATFSMIMSNGKTLTPAGYFGMGASGTSGTNTFTASPASFATKFMVGGRLFSINAGAIANGTYVTSTNGTTGVVTLSQNLGAALTFAQGFLGMAGTGAIGTNTFTVSVLQSATAFEVGFVVENLLALPRPTTVTAVNLATGVITLSNNFTAACSAICVWPALSMTVSDRFGVTSTQYAYMHAVSFAPQFRWYAPPGVWYIDSTYPAVAAVLTKPTINRLLFIADALLPSLSSGTALTYSYNTEDDGCFITGARVTPSTYDAAYSAGATLTMRLIANSPLFNNSASSNVNASTSGGAVVCTCAASTRVELTRRNYVSAATVSGSTVDTGAVAISPTSQANSIVSGARMSATFSAGGTTATIGAGVTYASLLIFGSRVRPGDATLSTMYASSLITNIAGSTVTVAAPGWAVASTTAGLLYVEATVTFTSGSRIATVTNGLGYLNIGSVFKAGTGTGALNGLEVVRQPSGTNTVVLSAAPASSGTEDYVFEQTVSRYNTDVFVSTMVVRGDVAASNTDIASYNGLRLSLTVGGARATTAPASATMSVNSLRDLATGAVYVPAATTPGATATSHTFIFTPAGADMYTACGSAAEATSICVSLSDSTLFDPVIDAEGCGNAIANAPAPARYYPTSWFGYGYNNATWSATATGCDSGISSIVLVTGGSQNVVVDGSVLAASVSLSGGAVQVWQSIGGVRQTLPLQLYDRFNNTFFANLLSGVKYLVLRSGAPPVGAVLVHANLPTGTTVLSITGSVAELSAAATTNSTNTKVTFTYTFNLPMATGSSPSVTSLTYSTTWSGGGAWYLKTANSSLPVAAVTSSYVPVVSRMHFKGGVPAANLTAITQNEAGGFRTGASLTTSSNNSIVKAPDDLYIYANINSNSPISSSTSTSFTLYDYMTNGSTLFSPVNYNAASSYGAVRAFRWSIVAPTTFVANLRLSSTIATYVSGTVPSVGTFLNNGNLWDGTRVVAVSGTTIVLSKAAGATASSQTISTVPIWNVCDNNGDGSYTTAGETYAVLSTAYAPGAGSSGTSTFTCTTAAHASLFRVNTYVTSSDGSVAANTTVTAVDGATGAITLSNALTAACTQLYPEMRLTLTRYDNRVQCDNGCVGYLGAGSAFNVAVGHPLYGLTVASLAGNYAYMNAPVMAAVSNPYTGLRLQDPPASIVPSPLLTLPTIAANWWTPTSQSGTQYVGVGQTMSMTLSFGASFPTLTLPDGFNVRVDPYATYVNGGQIRANISSTAVRTATLTTFTAVNPGTTAPGTQITFSTTNAMSASANLMAQSSTTPWGTLTSLRALCGQSFTLAAAMYGKGVIYSSMIAAAPSVTSIALASSTGGTTAGPADTMTSTIAINDLLSFPITQMIGYVWALTPNVFRLFNNEGSLFIYFMFMMVNARGSQQQYNQYIFSPSATQINQSQSYQDFDQLLLASILPNMSGSTDTNNGNVTVTFVSGSASATVVTGRYLVQVGSMIYSRYLNGGSAQVTAYTVGTGAATLSMKATASVTGTSVLTAYAYGDVVASGQPGYAVASNNYVTLKTTHPLITVGTPLYSVASYWSAPAAITKYGYRYTLANGATATNESYTATINTSALPASVTFTNASTTAVYNWTAGPFWITAGCSLTSASFLTGSVVVTAVTRVAGPAYQLTLASPATASGTDANVAVAVTMEITNGSALVFVTSGSLEVAWQLLAGASLVATTVNSFNNILARMNQTATASASNVFFGFPLTISAPVTMNSTLGSPTTFEWLQTRYENAPNAYSIVLRRPTTGIANTAQFIASLNNSTATLNGVSYTMPLVGAPVYNRDSTISMSSAQNIDFNSGAEPAFVTLATAMRAAYTVNFWLRPSVWTTWVSTFGFGTGALDQGLGCNMWQNGVAPGWSVAGAPVGGLIIGHLWFNDDQFAYKAGVTVGSIDTAVYHMVTLVWDGTNRIVYFDGALFHTQATASGVAAFTGSQLLLGRFFNAQTNNINVTYADFRMWSSALSATNVADMFAAGLP